MGEMKNAYAILIGKPEGIRPLLRHRSSWEDNIKMRHEVTVCEVVG
jgi:hypothetical protein